MILISCKYISNDPIKLPFWKNTCRLILNMFVILSWLKHLKTNVVLKLKSRFGWWISHVEEVLVAVWVVSPQQICTLTRGKKTVCVCVCMHKSVLWWWMSVRGRVQGESAAYYGRLYQNMSLLKNGWFSTFKLFSGKCIFYCKSADKQSRFPPWIVEISTGEAGFSIWRVLKSVSFW